MATRLQKNPRIKAPPPFAFVLDELAGLSYTTRSMFGCLAIYLGDKIVLILREKDDYPRDNGVWIATVPEHHESLRKTFPTLRDIGLFGKGPTAWQVLPSETESFEADALKACRLVVKGDPRIGKVPIKKKKSGVQKAR